VFRTLASEKDKLVLQLGTENPEKALEAARLVEDHVSAIDINMGCPKSFSTKGGRGSALMNHPEKIYKLLTCLVENLKVPVTCKIRVFDDFDKTIELVKKILTTGISALAVHGRTAQESYSADNRDSFIAEIKKISNIPIIANGLSNYHWHFDDIMRYKSLTGADSLMIARKASANPSVFSKTPDRDINNVIVKYLEYAKFYATNYSHVIYSLKKMLKHNGTNTQKMSLVNQCHNMTDVIKIWNVEEPEIKTPIFRNVVTEIGTFNELIIEDDKITFPVMLKNLKQFSENEKPKQKLNFECLRKYKKLPKYEIIISENKKYFKTQIQIEDKVYKNSLWNNSKRLSDNAAALAYFKIKELMAD